MLRQLPLVLSLSLMAGCAMTLSSPESQPATEVDDRFADMVMEEGRVDKKAKERPGKSSANRAMPAPASMDAAGGDAGWDADESEGEEEPAPEDDASGDAPAEEGAAKTRTWFPETFLWQPLVETGTEGTAEVDVLVPDQLTTWRVLGLAHSGTGSQSGAVHTFDSRMDLYVEPVVPDFVYVGDRLELPVQVVNTSDVASVNSLDVGASGALEGSGVASLTVQPRGSALRSVGLSARGAGEGVITARFGNVDSVERTVRVVPRGMPHNKTVGGSLSGERAFVVTGPEGSDPATQRLAVTVYPGALAVLQAEVQRLGGGGRSVNPAYGFAVASRMSALSVQSGVEADPRAVRRIRQRAWQQMVQQAGYDPDHRSLPHLLHGLGDGGGHLLAEERVRIWSQALREAQRGDGTWAPSDSGKLQHLIVQTAVSGRSLAVTEEIPRMRAGAALDRLAPQVKDPYTAAVVLASGLLDDARREPLEKLVIDGIVEREDGSRTVDVPDGVQGVGGSVGKAEMLAWTRLALEGREDLTWRDDLVAELMQGFGPRGFGAGGWDVVALEAVAQALPTLPDAVDVVLLADGAEVARAKLDPAQPRQPVLLTASPRAEDPEYTLRVDGKAPGLAWTADLRSWTDWPAKVDTGVDLEVEARTLKVGQVGTVRITLAAPAGATLEVVQGLPSGAWVDQVQLERVPGVAHVVVNEDHVRFTTHRFSPGEILEVPLLVQPAFAGRFSTGPAKVTVTGVGRSREIAEAPMLWQVGS